MVIAKVESSPSDTPGSWVGRHYELHCTALGKALICYLSEEELERLFRKRGFAKYNPKTICSLKALMEDLAEARVRGYTVNDEEYTRAVMAVAAPVFSYTGGIVAAVSAGWSVANRSASDWRTRITREVMACARELSRYVAV